VQSRYASEERTEVYLNTLKESRSWRAELGLVRAGALGQSWVKIKDNA
jgi:hypothetical protein